jgi:DNA-directed RNA polymerase
MPNLVHSLDATSLALLYNSFYKETEKDNVVNFYSIHDCFAVTANNVELLINLLKSVYIDLYSGNTYLQKFDDDLISYIRSVYGEEKLKTRVAAAAAAAAKQQQQQQSLIFLLFCI